MAEYLLGKRKIQGHKENRPVNSMETDNVLSDQMKVCRPELMKLLRTVSVTVIANTGNVVGQSIQPYISNVLGIKGNRNSPAESSSGNTQILKPWEKEIVHHLIFSGYWLNKLRMVINILNQSVGILAHTEEISFFFGRLYLPSAVGTLSVYQLRLRKKGLTGSAVQSLIVSFINISLIIKLLKNLLNLSFVVLIRGADKLVIGRVHQIPNIFNLSCSFVYKFLRSDSGSLCLLLNLLTVLIGSCLEEHVIALCPFIPGNGISQNCLVGIADMRLTGSVGNSRCNIIWFFAAILTHCFPSCFLENMDS